MTQPDGLLPCPFCSGPAYYNYTDAGHDRRYDRVHCKNCDARIGHPYCSKDKAKAAWNTRAASPTSGAEALVWWTNEMEAARKQRNDAQFPEITISYSEYCLLEKAYNEYRAALSPAKPSNTPPLDAPILKGIGKINGDGWKDTTKIGEVVYVWNQEEPPPCMAGQYPRIGNEIWRASTRQYDFVPATIEEIRALLDAAISNHTAPVQTIPPDVLKAAVEKLEGLKGAMRHYAVGGDPVTNHRNSIRNTTINECIAILSALGKDGE